MTFTHISCSQPFVFRQNQSMVGDPIEKLLGLCGQTEVKPFEECFDNEKLSELAYKYRRNRSVNFAQLKKATVVRGALPEAFGSSWRKFEAQ
ncbi:uncharacterized protein DEA37_0011755, partial [Paragonimus westermani]